MNLKLIRYIIGLLLCLEAAFLAPVALCAFGYGEHCLWSILITMAVCAVAGAPMLLRKPANTVFSLREGYVTVALGWLIISIFGTVPFVLSGAIPEVIDAFFETVSGFTTTGATILSDVDGMPHALNLWRCMTHWIGGMGVLVFLMAIIPMIGGSSMNLMKAESTGPSVARILPTAKKSARLLYTMYIVITLAQILILLITGMAPFDAVTISLSTGGTGGFAARTASCAEYTVVQQIVINIFMMIFSINFTAFFLLMQRKFKEAFRIEEVRGYLLSYVAVTLIIAFSVRDRFDSIGEAIQQSAFQTASILTSSGFSTLDYGSWPTIACVLLIICMFVGSTSGSTGCGIKFCRILLLLKTIRRELLSYIHPGSVIQVRMDGKRVDDAVIRSVHVYIAAYIMIFFASLCVVALDGFDFMTSFTAIVGGLSNIGPGFGDVGPAGNYSGFSILSKLVLIFDMFAGRLEIFPVLMVLLPKTWKRF